MTKKYKIISLVALSLSLVLMTVWLLHGHNIAVLNPKGTIATQQRNLLIFTALLSLIVVIPVYALTIGIAWKYRASNKKATYKPNWDHSRAAETIWWLIPLVLILVLAVITWITSHALDPYRSIESHKKPLTIQVVALEWKWLFIYPEQHIASINALQIPTDTPVNFQITADAPMNSFWIPQLGGQIYAMAGMTTQLHLMANTPGDYRGSSANISGEGFSGMTFKTKARPDADFQSWVRTTQQSPNRLDQTAYDRLVEPSTNLAPIYYSLDKKNLYDEIVMKYMSSESPQAPPSSEAQHTHSKDTH